MNEKKKRRLKKFHFHPATRFLLLTLLVIIISFILNKLHLRSSYNVIDTSSMDVESRIVEVNNMLSRKGIKFIIGKAATNIASFSAFINLMVALIGLSVAHASGFIKAFLRRKTIKLNNKFITFLIIFLGICSSLINDVGYVILIPLAALIFAVNKRSPLLGITAAFCGVSFGYGISLFAGSLDVSLVQITELSSHLVDVEYHVPLLSNIFIMIVSTFILAFLGTFVIEGIIVNKIGKYKNGEELENTMNLTLNLAELDDKEIIELDLLEKRGLKYALIVGIIMILCGIYMIVPGLPKSGLLLDMSQTAYVNQLFGKGSSFQSGFTYMVSFWFAVVGIAYAIGAKTIKNDNELIQKVSVFFKDFGELMVTIFFFVQFVAIFKQTNIGLLLSCYGLNIINSGSITGIALIIVSMLIMAISGIFVTSALTKWSLFAPTVVPLMMQSNISPEFAQFILRAADSMTKGITPFLGYFIIYLGYMNIYNNNKEAITIRKGLSFILPYFLIIGLAWLVIVLGWYIIGLPLGPHSMPSL